MNIQTNWLKIFIAIAIGDSTPSGASPSASLNFYLWQRKVREDIQGHLVNCIYSVKGDYYCTDYDYPTLYDRPF